MKALVGAFNQEKALVGAFSVIVQLFVKPMEHYTALSLTRSCWQLGSTARILAQMNTSSGRSSRADQWEARVRSRDRAGDQSQLT